MSSYFCRTRPLLAALLVCTAFVTATAAQAQPAFTKAFDPSTIGPASASKLTFTINNGSASLVTGLAFTDVLPAGITIATPSSAATSCVDGVLSAPDGGNTISLTGGRVGANATCTVSVNVIGTSTALNTSGDLTSSAGNSGTASATLTVDSTRPGFSKSFSPPSIAEGSISTLTFTIDNTANGTAVSTMNFTDNLPAGMVVAPIPNESTMNCGSATWSPTPGSSSLSFSLGTVATSATCMATVDVTTSGNGLFPNVSGELGLPDDLSSGFATAQLNVPLDFLTKSFTDDPVVPGGNVTLQFRIQNPSRTSAATAITFDDVLENVISGLAPSGALPATPCGAGSMLSFAVGTGTLSLTGGSLAPEAFCTFNVTLLVPATAAAGSHMNTTGAVSATIDGDGVTGNMATDVLQVTTAPTLTKTFIGDPVTGGGTVTLRFVMTNISSATSATSIAFTDNLSAVLAGLAPASLSSPDPCSGATISTFTSISDLYLNVSGGALAPSGSCTIDITLNVPANAPAGTFLNTTSAISATVDSKSQSGKPATDSLIVVTAPRLKKEFTDDPTLPGGTATLRLTLTHDANNTANATGVGFTDNLGAALPGLMTAGAPTLTNCGGGTLTGTTTLTFGGGTLAPGDVCTITVPVAVPATAAAGSYTNTTSAVTATVSSVAVSSAAASDDLQVAGLTLTKTFAGDPVVPGGMVTLQFNLANTSTVNALTGIGFTDSLTAALAGLAAVGPLSTGTCNGTLTGTTVLTYSGGSLATGASCSFTVTVLVPAAAAPGEYTNTTSPVTADGGISVAGAIDKLTVLAPLSITKSFTNDPAMAGETVTLEFTLSNADPANAASLVDFSDNLGAALAGLTYSSLLFNDCGGTVGGTGTTMISFTGGVIAAGSSCTIRVSLTIPASPASASALNTTSTVSGTVNSVSVTGNTASDTLRINLLTFTKSFDDPVAAGSSVTLSFTITNLSTTTAVTDLAFADNVAGVLTGLLATDLPKSNVCGAGSLLSGTSLVTLTGGNLPASGSCTFDVTLAIPANATAGSYTNTTTDLQISGLPVATPATDMLDVTRSTDLSISKADSPDPVTAGTNLTYSLTVTNNGPSASTGGTVSDTLPAGTTFFSGTGCAEGPVGTVTCAIGALADGASQMVSFIVTVDPGQTADISNTATVAASEADPVSGNDSATETTTVVAETDLSITKTDSPDPVNAGEDLTYTMTVTNNGPSNSTGGTVTDVLPAGVSFKSGTGCAEGPVGTVTCAIGALGVGANQMVSFVVTVDAGQTAAISNTATVAANETDSTSANDSATANTAVNASTDLSITKTDSPDPVNPGEDLTYTLTVTNNGPSASTGGTVTDTLPAGTTFSSGTGCAEGPVGTVTCAIGALGVGANQMVSFVVTVDAGQTAPIDNTATIAANETDPIAANNSAMATTTVTGDDGDNVDAATENAGPNDGDCNNDGILDSLQGTVTAFPDPDTGQYVCATVPGRAGAVSTAAVIGEGDSGILVGPGCQIRVAAQVDVASLPPDQGLAQSFAQVLDPVRLEIECAAATVKIFYYGISDLSGAVYRKYGPTAAQPANHWYTHPATFGAETIGGATVATATFELVDGGAGDHDLMVNGRIVDPGGPALITADIPTLSQWALMLLAVMLSGAAILVLRSRG